MSDPAPATSPVASTPAPVAPPPVAAPSPVTAPASQAANTPASGPPATAVPAAPAAALVNMTSDQLKERLKESGDSATRALLKEIGFDKPDDLKAALKKLGDLETASLTEKEKLEKRIKELEPKALRVDTVTTMLNGLVEAQFKALPASVQQAIDAQASGDPDKRLSLMAVFQASGLLAAASAAAAAAPTTPAAPAPSPPVSVAPSPAPAPAGTLTKFQEWEAMRSRSPMLGDMFYQQNQREIERSRPA
jgi:hypothetical protein